MSLGLTFRKSFRDLQQCWARLADSAFAPAPHDEMARGEFISAFICDRGQSVPATPPSSDQRRP